MARSGTSKRLSFFVPTCVKIPLLLVTFTAFLISAGYSPIALGNSDSSMEYPIKAAFLYNFAKFVTWPDEAFENNHMPFIIGVLGDDPFGKIMEQTVADKKIKGRDIVIERFKRIEDIRSCHVLFIASSEQARLPESLVALENSPVLTVGEMQDFLTEGGVIKFVIIKNSVHFEINLDRAERSGLKISSKLLRLARVVHNQ